MQICLKSLTIPEFCVYFLILKPGTNLPAGRGIRHIGTN